MYCMKTARYFLPKQPIKGKAMSIHFKFTHIPMHSKINTLDGRSTEKWTMAFAYVTKTHLMISSNAKCQNVSVHTKYCYLYKAKVLLYSEKTFYKVIIIAGNIINSLLDLIFSQFSHLKLCGYWGIFNLYFYIFIFYTINRRRSLLLVPENRRPMLPYIFRFHFQNINIFVMPRWDSDSI